VIPIRYLSGWCDGLLPPTPKPIGAGAVLPERSLRSPQHVVERSRPVAGIDHQPTGLVRCAIPHCMGKQVTSESRFCVVHEPDEDGL
jgi:hypothetical protein